MRNTVQRQIILQAVQKLHYHPTAEEVYLEIKKEHPAISKSTVYRNLHQLTEAGEINQVLLSKSPERFDHRLSQHYHFRCKICDSIFDVDINFLSGINEAVESEYGFQVDEHDVIFKGTCPECRNM